VIDSPDDLPRPIDFDAPARRADLLNDSTPESASDAWRWELIKARFLANPFIYCGAQVAPEETK
jgi:hypothetical protein